MSKNLKYSLSPVTIGLSLDPSWPTRNNTSDNEFETTYKTDAGIPTLLAGDIVRLGEIFGVVMVDHQDKLAGFNEKPVINFGLNVWKIKGIIKTAADGTGHDVGTEVWYYDPAPDTTEAVDDATNKNAATLVRLFAGKPTASNHSDLTAGTGKIYKFGILLDSIAGTVAQDTSMDQELMVMMGGSGIPVPNEDVA